MNRASTPSRLAARPTLRARIRATVRRAVPVFLLAATLTTAHAQDNPLRFGVRLSPGLARKPVAGRLLVFMTNAKQNVDFINPGFGGVFGNLPPDAQTLTAAQETTNWMPGRQVTLNPDTLATPAGLSSAPKGDWQVMVLLDRDHSYGLSGPGPGDFVSDVVRLKDLDPAKAGSISVVLTKAIPAEKLPKLEGVRLVTFQSPSLSRFWGRPMVMRAGVVLPPGYETGRTRFATVYHVPGFGGDHRIAWIVERPSSWAGPGLRASMRSGRVPKMIHVFLDPNSTLGHTAFADSANNGPWGTALVREFIPYLERQFRMAGPRGRFLTGHSSGGWSTLWLQVSYPDAFNGTWSSAPDPVDFRSFTGVNLAKNPPENFFRTPAQTTRNLVRMNGQPIESIQEFVRFEQVAGDYGGQMQSFEAVFSPKGEDGRPMRLFDRQTGQVDPLVARHWEQYDIHRVLERNWPALGPKLRGKLHIWAGTQDNFHLEEAVRLLGSFLKAKGSDAEVHMVPGKDHGSLLTPALIDQMYTAMGARYRAAR